MFGNAGNSMKSEIDAHAQNLAAQRRRRDQLVEQYKVRERGVELASHVFHGTGASAATVYAWMVELATLERDYINRVFQGDMPDDLPLS